MKIIKFGNPLFQILGKVASESDVKVYVVGGYVRDYFLGHTSKDIDFVIEGNGPQYAENAAKELKSTNFTIYKKFGTAMVHHDDLILEFVGARKESYRDDSRNPDVESADLLTDISRRDFTVNAIAVSLNEDTFGQVIDPFNGQLDIKKKIIRTPLLPETTFYDDPLRIMRAVRFACKLDFTIEKKTFTGLSVEKDRLAIISQERITDELLKILACPKPSIGLKIMEQTGILDIILPEIAQLKGVDQIGKHSHKDVFEHTLKVIDNIATVSDDIKLRLTALYHDVAKPATKQFKSGTGWSFHGHDDLGARMLPDIFKRLKISNDILKYVEKLVRLHLRPIHLAEEIVTDSAIRRLIFDAGEHVDDLLTFCRADITSANQQRVQKHLQNFDYVVTRILQVEEKDKLRNFQPPVRGDEIMKAFDLKPGPLVGKFKAAVEEAILNGDIENDHDAAWNYLISIKESLLEQDT